jgi:hypothetical protein
MIKKMKSYTSYREIPAHSFMVTIAANVDNMKLSNAEFRTFIRNTLPIIKGIDYTEEEIKMHYRKDGLKEVGDAGHNEDVDIINCICGFSASRKKWDEVHTGETNVTTLLIHGNDRKATKLIACPDCGIVRISKIMKDNGG